jgi:hypothetical protein
MCRIHLIKLPDTVEVSENNATHRALRTRRRPRPRFLASDRPGVLEYCLFSNHQSLLTNHSPLLSLIQLVDPINQVVVVNRSPHDLIQLEQPLIFRSVIERDPRLSGVMTKHDFVPMNGLDL